VTSDTQPKTFKQYRQKCIERYTDAGFSLFPCTQNKTPLKFGWQQTVWEPALEPESLGLAYGVLLTATDLVLDIDPRRYIDNENQLTKFAELLQFDNPPKTFIVSTANGGVHIYFKKPAEVLIKCRTVPGFDAIEPKSKGRYVIGAGSIINGKPYKVKQGDPCKLINLVMPYAIE